MDSSRDQRSPDSSGNFNVTATNAVDSKSLATGHYYILELQ